MCYLPPYNGTEGEDFDRINSFCLVVYKDRIQCLTMIDDPIW